MFDVREYRKDLGYTNQASLKKFFDSKDIIREVEKINRNNSIN